MRVTLQDIANRLGLHVTTVSKALRGNPTIAKATRQRVVEESKVMGYVPDPQLRALADYRLEKRRSSYRASLAWICNHPKAEGMERFPAYADYWLGAKERAAAAGYGLEAFWVEKGDQELRQVLRLLNARGVAGIVLAPQAKICAIDHIDWDGFSVVSIGFTLTQPNFHRVSTDHYRLMRSLVRRLESEGSKRIGCYLNEEEQERTERRMIASATTSGESSSVFVKAYAKPERRSFLAWVKRNKLDTVVCASMEATTWSRSLASAPRVVAYAHEPNAAGVPGMYHNNRLIGDHSVALLDSMVRQGERGIPKESVEWLVEGKWVD